MIEIPSIEEIPDLKIMAVWEQKAAISVLESGVNVLSAIKVSFHIPSYMAI